MVPKGTFPVVLLAGESWRKGLCFVVDREGACERHIPGLTVTQWTLGPDFDNTHLRERNADINSETSEDRSYPNTRISVKIGDEWTLATARPHGGGPNEGYLLETEPDGEWTVWCGAASAMANHCANTPGPSVYLETIVMVEDWRHINPGSHDQWPGSTRAKWNTVNPGGDFDNTITPGQLVGGCSISPQSSSLPNDIDYTKCVTLTSGGGTNHTLVTSHLLSVEVEQNGAVPPDPSGAKSSVEVKETDVPISWDKTSVPKGTCRGVAADGAPSLDDLVAPSVQNWCPLAFSTVGYIIGDTGDTPVCALIKEVACDPTRCTAGEMEVQVASVVVDHENVSPEEPKQVPVANNQCPGAEPSQTCGDDVGPLTHPHLPGLETFGRDNFGVPYLLDSRPAPEMSVKRRWFPAGKYHDAVWQTRNHRMNPVKIGDFNGNDVDGMLTFARILPIKDVLHLTNPEDIRPTNDKLESFVAQSSPDKAVDRVRWKQWRVGSATSRIGQFCVDNQPTD